MSNAIQPFHLLVIALAGWLNRQQQVVIDYLIEENRVLKEQLGGQRLMFTDEQRMRLAVKAKLLGRRGLTNELRTFAPCKAKPTWVFTGMEVCSRLWSSTVVGRRSYANTKALFSDTPLRGEVVGTPLIMTDGFEFYERVIRRLLGVACIYAQVIKTRRKDRITRVERRVVIGTTRRLEKALDESEDSARANTAYIERLNLTIRQSVAYLRRRSLSHARCERRLHRPLELARCHYNFIRRHTGLRFGRELRTPAMVAGLRDRVCSFRDFFAFA